MRSVDDVIAAFGGPSAFARAIGLRGPSTATEMLRSGSIAGRYWYDVVTQARRRGIHRVTYQALARMHRIERT